MFIFVISRSPEVLTYITSPPFGLMICPDAVVIIRGQVHGERGILLWFAQSAERDNLKERVPLCRANFFHVRIELRCPNSSRSMQFT